MSTAREPDPAAQSEAHAGFADHFSAHAPEYARHRPHYPPQLARALAERCAGRSVAWESGCGSGQLTLDLAQHFERVRACDASAEQLAQAPPHARVEYLRAVAHESGLADASADLAVAAQAAHWFDLQAWYAEVSRVLRPGGLLALCCYGGVRAHGELDALLQRIALVELAPHWPAERRLVDEGYRSLRPPLAEIEAPHFELHASWALGELLGYLSTWSALGRYERARGALAVVELRARIARAWGEPERARELRWPLALRLFRR
jgi:SAM-dependent methyltransferase